MSAESGTRPERTGSSASRAGEPVDQDQPDVTDTAVPPRRQWAGRIGGPVAALVVYFLLRQSDDLSTAGRTTAAIGVLLAVWWMTEALPLPATALVPIVAFPLLGVLPVGEATAPYADPNIFLFMGGFMIALAMQKWELHRRIALLTVRAVGTEPNRLIGGFMVATAFLSMWVSNTATTVLMLPIGLSVLLLVLDRVGAGDEDAAAADQARGGTTAVTEAIKDKDTRNFAVALMLGIAYAASIGSLATLIGTPPNLILAAFVRQNYDIVLGFGEWMLLGLPLAVVFLGLAWLVLTKVAFRSGLREIPGGRQVIQSELDQLGKMSRGEWTVLAVFVVTALLWVFRQPLTGWEALTDVLPFVAELSDPAIAIAAAIALFLIPVKAREGVSVLDWHTAQQLPWGVLLLFGGGLSLAAAVQESGLDEYIGGQVGAVGALPAIVLVSITAGVVLLLTEVTSNTATAAAFLPVLGGVALGLDLLPLVLLVPAALAATCAFMLPVATPPNAIVFGSGYVTIGQMLRAGVVLNVIGIVLITAAVYLLGGVALGITF
ncbi:SLC13 family permease [Modestobacter roseus]|uniref:Sodium-dependent dicarboxylate transporter SdcS n=1 Tax=Modestobacter roseus TaxID=1181884 RepID=A0A562IPE2_9ACTN|nr:DASS family sodium-coupled anion symporter [Modestobacter roseus]MQA35354.1 DASS family sodium-coupled anion symporter [Modestobacter roseus]TWH72573.1 sodium-dependent dicarboxylate transporter 2/3/5 [Modestobacter roseus]